MIRLVIDTNRLPTNLSSPSAAFRRVCGLVGEDVVEVVMPSVLAEEWRTQQLEQLKNQMQKAQQATKGLLGGGHLEGHPQVSTLEPALTALDALSGEVEGLSQRTLQRLVEQLQAEVIPVADAHGRRVISSYFEGGPPFSGIKARQDFPDAYAYEAILDTLNDGSNDPVVVVTSDKNLAKHLSSVNNVTCHDTLEAFVESEMIQAAIAAVQSEVHWRAALPNIVAALQVAQHQMLDVTFVNSFINKLAGMEVSHSFIPSDSNDAIVSMVDDPGDIDVAWNEAEDYGPGILRVPFSCESELLLDFYVYYADSYALPEYISVQYLDPEEHHYFEAQAHAMALVRGHLVISLEDWSEEDFIESASVLVDDITAIELQKDDVGNALY
jgi:PIN domain